MFIALLIFIRTLATQCLSLNNKLCMIGRTPTDLNLIKPDYFQFMISLGKRSGS